MLRVYRFRLYSTPAQDERMRWLCERLRELYNAALEERREAYRKQGTTLSAYGQMAELKAVRDARPEYADIHVHLLQDVLTRLDRAYRAFFRRVKAGEKAGFPRFRGRGRYGSFTFKDAKNRNGVAFDPKTKRLRITGIGEVKVKVHRRSEGVLKQVTVTLGGDGNWYACLCCDDVPEQRLPATGESVGVDLGIKTFAALSTGEQIRAKAECAGREVWEVDPRGTSQRCSGCGIVVPKKLSDRIHNCPECGLVLDRDENAARNIHAAGHAVRGGLINGSPVEPRSLSLAR